jgi:5'-nucleotidase
MTNTLKTRKKLSFGIFAVVASLAVTMVTPIAQANVVYSTPSAPTNVTSYLSARGVVVKWTPSATATPAITHYVVSAGSGSCPILVPVTSRNVVTMPVVVGQPGGTPVVQAVNAYGFSAAAKSKQSYTAAQLATVASASNIKSVQVLQLSDLHGAIEASSGSNIGAAVLASAFANDRKNAAATVTLSAGDNIGAAPPISTEFEEMPTIEAMNLMKFDVSAFGNHEHDRN